MSNVLTTDHPAWQTYEDGTRARAVRTASGIWTVSHDRDGLHLACVDGTEDVKPEFVATDPAHLPPAAPAALREALAELGITRRLANPWLWDAITTAILRQVVRADQARKVYRTWCSTYGTTVEGPQGALAVAPTPAEVLALADEQFAAVGAKFHRTALTAAATHYEQHHSEWEHMEVGALAAAPGPPRSPPPTPGPARRTRRSVRCGPAGPGPTAPLCTASPSPPSPGGRTPDDMEDVCSTYR